MAHLTISIAARLASLPEFPFRRLTALLADIEPASGKSVLDFSIGEPKHAPPDLLAATVNAHAGDWNRYPPSLGTPAFKQTVAAWLERRFTLKPDSVDPNLHVLPLAGTKEGLFLLPSIATDKVTTTPPIVLMPNPLYSVYLGATALAGLEPILLPTLTENGFLPDLTALDPTILDRTALFFLCSPANPQGSVADQDYLAHAINLARQHNFTLVVDECYAELYDKEPPPGGLGVAQSLNGAFDHVVVMHSLSKRSNAAGLRSGFIAGDADVIARFARLRAYGAAVQPLPLMAAATALWQDEAHVVANRQLYRRKFDVAERKLGNRYGFYRPAGGFFLWLDVGDGVEAARRLWQEAALKVLPGAFLTATTTADEPDPGYRFIRMALVHDETMVADALDRLIDVLN